MKYQYHDLTPEQFEELVIAVCTKLLGIGVHGFSSGKDGGRDARFHGKAESYPSKSDSWDGLIIIQAKHTIGFNQKFSDPEFSKNKSSVLFEEIKSIKELVNNNEIDYYMLFSNRKLPANANEEIINLISKETGLDKQNIALFGIESFEQYFKFYPQIINMISIDTFDMPLIVSPDDLAEIVEAFAKNKNKFSNKILQNDLKAIKEIKRKNFSETKNKENNLSDDYAKLIQDKMNLYYDDITNFLAHPENIKIKNFYEEVVEEFNMEIFAHKKEYDSFDNVLNYLYKFLIERDIDLKRNKKLTRVFLFYMYYFCDIG